MDPHFVLFGTAHKIAIALAFVVPLALALVVRMSKSAVLVNAVRWLFAAELIATYILWYWLLIARGWAGAGNILPMHLCDWAAIACVVSLIRPNQRTYELAYFWALSATLQATLTPELALGWPDLRFVVFFAFHCGVIAAVLYMTLGMRMRPYPKIDPARRRLDALLRPRGGSGRLGLQGQFRLPGREVEGPVGARPALALAVVHRRARADRLRLHPDPLFAVLHRRSGPAKPSPFDELRVRECKQPADPHPEPVEGRKRP